MELLQHALALAEKGFHIFPLHAGQKEPAISEYPEHATRDEKTLRKWWKRWPNANIGISTSRFGDGTEALLGIDIDNKNGKNGDATLVRAELEGFEFPATYEQRTPTGGRHLVYRVAAACKQGAGVFGDGVDTRSRGGYLVGAGSVVAAGRYAGNSASLALAHGRVVEHCGRAIERAVAAGTAVAGVDAAAAETRARFYLEHEAPTAVQGDAGDQETFRVACRVKDLGVPREKAFELMFHLWNDRCQPPWTPDELAKKVDNAYRYGADAVGAASPEADFKPVDTDLVPAKILHPFDELNKEYSFAIVGGGHRVLWETHDAEGNFNLVHLSVETFELLLAARRMQVGEKPVPITKLWLNSERRRTYNGICFLPGSNAPKGFYNLWRGFAVAPLEAGEVATVEMQDSVKRFTDHAFENICHGEPALFAWLMGYFAHLVQRPWEKPLVALVFKGKKGVGKSALIDRIGYLLGDHFFSTADKRYLTGNFNSHLQNCLMIGLEEAFWSGDSQSDGILKHLVTGTHHMIEYKGKEPYKVKNLTRAVVIGNEEWLVPATADERRYAVFNVGEGRMQDRDFFKKMREGMERGGYRLLLRHLLDFPISDVDQAPATVGLLEQKLQSIDPFYQWWFECLTEGEIPFSDFTQGWPPELLRTSLRSAFLHYAKERQIRGWMSDDRQLGILLHRCMPSLKSSHKRKEAERFRVYLIPPLEQARAEWCRFIGHQVEWPKDLTAEAR